MSHTDRCPCDLCNGRLTGAWEDWEDAWLDKAYADEKAYWEAEGRRMSEEFARDLAWLREQNICPGCGESPWDTDDGGPCTRCLTKEETNHELP